MESFEQILKAGGRTNSLGRASEILAVLSSNHTRLDELFTCISADDAWVRMRAIDTFEKLVKDDPELAQPYLEFILTELTKSVQPSIQWHLAQIFSEVSLTEGQQLQAIEWLKQRIQSVDVDWIVSVNTMKSLLFFHKAGHVSAKDLEPLFTVQTNHASKTVRKKANEFLSILTNTN